MEQVVVVSENKIDQDADDYQDNQREQEIDQMAGQKPPMDRKRLRILVWSIILMIMIITGFVVFLPK
jgi:hypothetical protein